MAELGNWADVLGIIGTLISAAFFVWKALARFAAEPEPIVDTPQPSLEPQTVRPPAFVSLGKGSCPHEKLKRLLHALSRARQSIGSSDEDSDSVTRVLDDLDELQFLQPGDLLDGQYRLVNLLARGQRSHVWQAVDEQSARIKDEKLDVVLKVLKHRFSTETHLANRFLSSVRLARGVTQSEHRPFVKEIRSPGSETAKDCIAYYSMTYVNGVSLENYVLERSARRSQKQWLPFSIDLTRKLLELARSVIELHKQNIVHNDIQPGNILVCVDKKGQLERCCLLDLDACTPVSRLADSDSSASRRHGAGENTLDERAIGFVAPELLQGNKIHSPQVDIFSLARVLTFVFSGKPLPHPYARGSEEIIRHLYCPPKLLKPLLKATRINPENRQPSLETFIDQVEEALDHYQNAAAHVRWAVLCRAERSNISQTLKYAFVGALIPMMLSRPWLAAPKHVHLSDTFSIGVFHAVLGSFIWALLITGGFLLYQTLLEQSRIQRTSISGYVLAGMLGGLGGFLGGILCAILGGTITNACTLVGLEWIAAGALDCKVLNTQGLNKVLYTLGTHLFWAYPLTGTFTGIGLGLWLNFKVNVLSAEKLADVIPVPKRQFEVGGVPVRASLRFVLKHPASHLLLMLPIFAAGLAWWAFPESLEHGPIQVHRALGEGFVHYLAATGLAIGFFLGVAPGRNK